MILISDLKTTGSCLLKDPIRSAQKTGAIYTPPFANY